MSTFSALLKPLVDEIGAAESASLCGVTPRAIYLWMKGPAEPNTATQVGAIHILKNAKIIRKKTCKPLENPET